MIMERSISRYLNSIFGAFKSTYTDRLKGRGDYILLKHDLPVKKLVCRTMPKAP
jgi:hypothetical protein